MDSPTSSYFPNPHSPVTPSTEHTAIEMRAGPSSRAAPPPGLWVAPISRSSALHDINEDGDYPESLLDFEQDERISQRPASWVSPDHFDSNGMEGVKELRRLSRLSARIAALEDAALDRTPAALPPAMASSVNAAPNNDSQETLAPGEPFDLEKVMRVVKKKRQQNHIKSRELGVVFQDLRVVGLGATAEYQPTLGSTFNVFQALAGAVHNSRHPPIRNILSGFEGVVRPGEMLLVLGRPGSGCSTLLKTLANQREEFHAIDGNVNYDSFTPQEIWDHYRGDVQYCPEDDVHFPTLTVDQTLRFAVKSRAPHNRFEGHTREQFVSRYTEVLETIFGLSHVKDTVVGDAKVRGISGGQKKRVSIAEALATRSLVSSWDNSTRGLDASTALEFVRALRIATDSGNLTTIASIYQAGESLYKLFDKVCLINDGKMVYFGPAHKARQYFVDMGYEPHNRQTTADFLVSVTDPNGRTIRSDVGRPVPLSADEQAAYFKQSELGQLNRDDIMAYREKFVGKPSRIESYKESARAEHANHTRKKSPYTISIPMQARAVMQRRVQILMGSLSQQVIKTLLFVFQGIIVGTVFFKLSDTTSHFFSRGGAIFFALFFTALSAMSEIPALFAQRPIVARHSKGGMAHPFIEAVALTLVDIPLSFFTLAIFVILVYFMVGLQRTVGQFFTFFLILFTMTIVMQAWFRLLAASFKSSAPAQAVAGIAVMALSLYTGYSIPRPSMIGALKWLTWINPLRYGFEAVMSNEFHTLRGRCSTLVPSGPGYENATLANQVCTAVGSELGQAFVDGNRYLQLSYGYEHKFLWRDYGIIAAFGIAFLVLLLIATEFNTALKGEGNMILYKRGTKVAVVQDSQTQAAQDSEKQVISRGSTAEVSDTADEKKAITEAPSMTDVFSWHHIKYTVPVGKGEKRMLLDDVSGFVAPGKLTALMGESGAGKTTLLNVLASRFDVGVVTGDKFVNGQALPSDFQAQTGYVQQMDTHLETATVREALLFSAKTRQAGNIPLAEKEAYVELCLKMCGLLPWADAIIGSLGVEHRKRTTIGVELAAKPKLLLFLDEPTSGLDSQSAWAIVQFLRSLADSGQAILCTIHQPSAELFQVFDRLLLLKKGGQTVFFGDLGHHAQQLIAYLEQNGARKILDEENPAEYMLDIIGAGATATADRDWHQIWNASPESQRLQKELERMHSEGRNRPAVAVTLQSAYATSWPYQVSVLLQRSFQSYWRDPTYLMSKLFLNIFAGLFIGFTFFQAVDSQQGTQNKLFSMFMATIVSVALAQQLQVPFLHVRTIYEIRERPSRMYSWSALVTSQILVELPWNFIGSTLFFFCWYWTVGFESSRAGYSFLMLAVFFPIYYTTIGQAVAAMSANAEIAAMLFSFLFSFVLTFDGVLQPYRLLGWWKWMYRLSPFTYLIEGLIGQALGHQSIRCAAHELNPLNPPQGQTCGDYMQSYISRAGGYLQNPGDTSQCLYCPVNDTDTFLADNFNIFYSHHWRNLGLMAAFCCFNIFAIYFFTYFFRIRKSKRS